MIHKEDMEAHGGNVSAEWNNTVVSSSPSALTNTIVIVNMDGEMTSSNASSASHRRKRSKRFLEIIEQAAAVFLELRRREQLTPPKQRKEAMEKQAEEEGRSIAEKECLKVIDAAKEEGFFSAILDQMKKQRKSLTVVKASASAIALEPFCKDETVFFDVCEEGGVEELVSGAALHGTLDEGLAVCFCRSFQWLSEHLDNKVGHLVRSLGAPSIVIEVLEQHKTCAEVQTAGCECVASIAEGRRWAGLAGHCKAFKFRGGEGGCFRRSGKGEVALGKT